MGNIAVRIEGVGKQYYIGSKPERYRTIRDSLSVAVFAPIRRIADVVSGRTNSATGNTETIWALKDVSFDIRHGEVIGIIGRNGAGKSTLLKILSRITEPSKGSIKMNGRVGALLEVGTGFHAELTGRENIYLNAAILGMTRRQIDRKFDEIVAFAEVEKFIDTPVKHYSSGMGLRLGFAVAAHLEPDILIVDEVLAVGDAEFQKKCLGKISNVASQGRTVLFVSHNMAAIDGLCQRGIILEQGQLVLDATAHEAVERYLSGSKSVQDTVNLSQHANRASKSIPYMDYLQIVDCEGNPRNEYSTGESFAFKVGIVPHEAISNPQLGIGVDNALGQRVFTVSTKLHNVDLGQITETCEIECLVESVALAPGRYRVKLAFGSAYEDFDVIESFEAFGINPTDYFRSGKLTSQHQGVILVNANWSIRRQDRNG